MPWWGWILVFAFVVLPAAYFVAFVVLAKKATPQGFGYDTRLGGGK